MVKINLEDYDEAATFGPVTKYEQQVRTPGWPDEEASCRKVFYEAGHYFKVSRVSTLGWCVTEYDEDGRVMRRSSSLNLGYFDDEQAAHDVAREWVEEYVNA